MTDDSTSRALDETATLRPSAQIIGERLREHRLAAGVGVRELSRRIGITASMISQMERGSVMPSVATLYAIVRELNVSFDDLFRGDAANGGASSNTQPLQEEEGPVRRHDRRKALTLDTGVKWELLTTREDEAVDFLYATYPPGSASTADGHLTRHGGREYGIVEHGRLGVTVGFETYELSEGDSISFDSTVPHRLFAIGDEAAEVIWFVVGRRTLDASAGEDDRG